MDLPGIYSTHDIDIDGLKIHARWAAALTHTTPRRVYVLNAAKYYINGEEVKPVTDTGGIHNQTEHADNVHHDRRYLAEFLSEKTLPDSVTLDENVIIFHIDEFAYLCEKERFPSPHYDEAVDDGGIPPLPSFVEFHLLSELHELTHWGLEAYEQPEGNAHWAMWNPVLSDIISNTLPEVHRDVDYDYRLGSMSLPADTTEQRTTQRTLDSVYADGEGF